MLKSKQELEKQITFYNFLKERNSSIDSYFDIIELENLDGLTEDAWKILNECGSVVLKLDSCNGLSKETLERLAINRKITYQFVDDRSEDGYTIEDLFKIYNVLETFKFITASAENNIHKIIMVCYIITLLVWHDSKGDISNEYSTKEDVINSRSLKGILFDGKAVCQGYALALKIILNYLGIETTIVGGFSVSDYHAWNQVKDEVFYNLDLTLDWQAFLLDLPLNNTLKNDEQFYKNHSTEVSWEDYSNLKSCPKSIPNDELRYYTKIIPEDLKIFLLKNQSKGLYKILEYTNCLNTENTINRGK